MKSEEFKEFREKNQIDMHELVFHLKRERLVGSANGTLLLFFSNIQTIFIDSNEN